MELNFREGEAVEAQGVSIQSGAKRNPIVKRNDPLAHLQVSNGRVQVQKGDLIRAIEIKLQGVAFRNPYFRDSGCEKPKEDHEEGERQRLHGYEKRVH
jgi:hypothetical protein